MGEKEGQVDQVGDRVGCAWSWGSWMKATRFRMQLNVMGPGNSPQVSSQVRYHRRVRGALLVSGGLLMACALAKVVMKTLLRVTMLFQVVTAFGNMLVLGVRQKHQR